MNRGKFSAGYSHPNWQRKRLEVMSERGFSCDACGDRDSLLHVHHKVYEKGKAVHEADSENLEVLCKSCHERVEEMVKAVRRLGGWMIAMSQPLGDVETPLECMIRCLDYRDEKLEFIDHMEFFDDTYGKFIATAESVFEDHPELQDGGAGK